MAVYKRGKNRWRIVIWLKGKPRERVVRGTKAEAKEEEARWKTELLAEHSKSARRDVPEFYDFCLNEYVPSAELSLGEGTWRRRRTHLASLMEFFEGYRLNEFDGAALDAYLRLRSREEGIRNVSLNNEMRVLRRVLNFAVEERGVRVKLPKFKSLPEGKKRVRVWTEEQVDRLLAKCAELQADLLPMLVFLANTGCRRGEALALLWEHVDLKRGFVRIWPHEDTDEEDDPWEPKSKAPREVTISDALRPWLVGRRTSATWVFPCPTTKERYAFWPERKYQEVQKAAGLRGGVHTLRHTFASHFLQEQPDFFLLAKVLGHSQTRVTELYSHLLPEHLERSRNAVVFKAPVSPKKLRALKAEKEAKGSNHGGNHG